MTSIDGADPALYIMLSALPYYTQSRVMMHRSISDLLVGEVTASLISRPSILMKKPFRAFCVPACSQTPRFSSFHIQPRFKIPSKDAPGEQFEVRQTSATDDWHPNLSKSLPLSKEQQTLIDDIIALYSMQPTIERVKRYTPDYGMIPGTCIWLIRSSLQRDGL
jgi:hypothetical protein